MSTTQSIKTSASLVDLPRRPQSHCFLAWTMDASRTPPLAGSHRRLRRRDAQAHCAGADVATRRRSGATPTQAPRRSRRRERQRVVLWWGSRRRSRRGLPHRMALPRLSEAASSVDLRSPGIAARSPLPALLRRTAAAALDKCDESFFDSGAAALDMRHRFFLSRIDDLDFSRASFPT